MGAYRGYGQAESNYVREVLVDRLARRLGQDPADFRRRNLLRPDELPFKNVSGVTYDSGDYARGLDLALSRVGYDVVPRPAERMAAAGAPRGRRHVVLRGVHRLSVLGVPRPGRSALRRLRERDLRMDRAGRAAISTGVSTFGQGTETTFAQIAASLLGLDPADVAIHRGDSQGTPYSVGGFASRTMIAGAGAIEKAAGADPRQDAAHRRHHPRRRRRRARDDRRRDPPPRRSVRAGLDPARVRSGLPRLSAAAGRGSGARGDGVLRSAVVGVRLRHRGRPGGGGRAQRRVRAAALHPGPRLRHPGQPDDRRGPGAGRSRAGHRGRAVRGARLRPRDGAARQRDDGRLLHADGGRPAGLRARPPGDTVAGHAVRHQGCGRGRRPSRPLPPSRMPCATRWRPSAWSWIACRSRRNRSGARSSPRGRRDSGCRSRRRSPSTRRRRPCGSSSRTSSGWRAASPACSRSTCWGPTATRCSPPRRSASSRPPSRWRRRSRARSRSSRWRCRPLARASRARSATSARRTASTSRPRPRAARA